MEQLSLCAATTEAHMLQSPCNEKGNQWKRPSGAAVAMRSQRSTTGEQPPHRNERMCSNEDPVQPKRNKEIDTPIKQNYKNIIVSQALGTSWVALPSQTQPFVSEVRPFC